MKVKCNQLMCDHNKDGICTAKELLMVREGNYTACTVCYTYCHTQTKPKKEAKNAQSYNNRN